MCKLTFLYFLLDYKSTFLSSKLLALSFLFDLELHLLSFHVKLHHLDAMQTPCKVSKLRLITTDWIEWAVDAGAFVWLANIVYWGRGSVQMAIKARSLMHPWWCGYMCSMLLNSEDGSWMHFSWHRLGAPSILSLALLMKINKDGHNLVPDRGHCCQILPDQCPCLWLQQLPHVAFIYLVSYAEALP